MKNRAIKLIICICVISCLMVGFCTAFASAADPAWLIRLKSGIAATALASQLVLQPINIVLDSPLSQSIDPLGKVEYVETLPEYLDRSVIKVVENAVVIDGVQYSELWLGPEAADKLRLSLFDFTTAYNIANNQSEAISYATGYGYYDGVPIYSVNGSDISQTFVVPYGIGNSQWGNYAYIRQTAFGSDTTEVRYVDSSIGGTDFVGNLHPGKSYSFYYDIINANRVVLKNKLSDGSTWYSLTLQPHQTVVSDPFSFDYTSGVIDAPIPQDDGLLVRIPTSYSDPQTGTVIYDIHDLINISPTVTQPGGKEINIDPDLNPDFQTDIDLGNNVGDLIRIILGLLDLIDNIDIEYAPEPESPEPPPEPGTIDPLPDPVPAPDDPTPGTTIANTDWTKLDELLRWIQSTIDSIRHLTESLQTMLDSIFDAIQSAIQHIAEIPEAIRELADKILEDIELGPSKLFDKALDILKSLFMPLLLPIKAMMGLWHYVVEWIQSISSPFTWIFGVMSGTSYNLVLPIYAVLAGSICIAIYKALGR